MNDHRHEVELKNGIRSEQVKALYRAPAIMLANPINASLLAVAVWPAYPAWILSCWVALFWILIGVRLIDRARYLRDASSAHDIDWGRRFSAGAAATGFLWGLAGTIVFVSTDPITYVLVTFVVGGMTVGAVMQASAYLPAFFSYVLPAVVPQAALYLASGERVTVVMGLMLTAYAAAVAMMGRHLNRWITETIRLRLVQADTNSELQAAVARNSSVLREIEQIYQYSPVGLCLMGLDHRFVRINEHMAEINGQPASAHIGRTLGELIPGLADRILELHRPVYECGESVLNAEIQGEAPSAPGTQRYWLANFFPFRSETGKIAGLMAAVLDITELKQAQLALRESEERFRAIFNSVNDLIFVHDIETGAFREVNRRACETFKYTRDEMLQLKIGELSENIPPYTGRDLLARMQEARSGQPQTFDWRAKAKDGQVVWMEISLCRATFGGRDFLLSTARDISKRKEAENRLTRMAQFDLLTGLPNRRVFVGELDRALERARRGGHNYAILYLDFDHFKDVNDTLGHPIGDRLLQSFAERLRENVRATDTLARFGGDEFALLMADITDPADAGVLAEKLLQIMDRPFVIDGNRIQTGLSIGIATYQSGVADAETLLAHADVALYRAKSEGRNTYRFFTAAMDAEVQRRVALTSELHEAIAANQLFLMYQPQVDIETSSLVGLEALVRWDHPRRGILLPGEFLPAAERSGLIVLLGAWAMRAACQQIREWLDQGVALPPFSINVSPLQFKGLCEFEKLVNATLAETGLPPESLELEITETALMGIWNADDNVLERLRGRGLRIAIDDFGTGYSSLLYLRRFPIDRIKIAHEFVKDIGIESNDTAIVKAAISLARELAIGVIAEGVETADQVRLLHEWGCRQAQGFFFAKPMPAKDVLPLLRSGSVMRWLAKGPDAEPVARQRETALGR